MSPPPVVWCPGSHAVPVSLPWGSWHLLILDKRTDDARFHFLCPGEPLEIGRRHVVEIVLNKQNMVRATRLLDGPSYLPPRGLAPAPAPVTRTRTIAPPLVIVKRL